MYKSFPRIVDDVATARAEAKIMSPNLSPIGMVAPEPWAHVVGL